MCPGWLLAGWPWLAADLLVAVGWLGPVETPLERPRGACRGQLVQRAFGRRQRGYGRTNTIINTKQRAYRARDASTTIYNMILSNMEFHFSILKNERNFSPTF
jgi:hypothetical protein